MKSKIFEMPPPGAGLETLTWRFPPTISIVDGTTAISRVLLMTIVERPILFPRATESAIKPVPFTVRRKVLLNAVMVIGLRLVRVGTGLGVEQSHETA